MANNFMETINEMGYKVFKNENNRITIVKETFHTKSFVVFNNQDKCIHGFLTPNCIISNEDSLREFVKHFYLLKDDLYKLSSLSKYKLLNYFKEEEK